MLKITLTALPAGFFLLTQPVLAQSKKEIRNANIEVISEYKEQDGQKYLGKTELYDSTGNLVEEKSYDKYGDVTEHKTWVFNSEGKKIEENDLDPASGKYLKQKKYTYTNGEVSIKEEYVKGKLTETTEYSYQENWLIKKTIRNAKGEIISVRDITYTYRP